MMYLLRLDPHSAGSITNHWILQDDQLLTIGRPPSRPDILIDGDSTVSEKHATISCHGQTVTLKVFSKNGMIIQSLVTGPNPRLQFLDQHETKELQANDLLYVGRQHAQLLLTDRLQSSSKTTKAMTSLLPPGYGDTLSRQHDDTKALREKLVQPALAQRLRSLPEVLMARGLASRVHLYHFGKDPSRLTGVGGEAPQSLLIPNGWTCSGDWAWWPIPCRPFHLRQKGAKDGDPRLALALYQPTQDALGRLNWLAMALADCFTLRSPAALSVNQCKKVDCDTLNDAWFLVGGDEQQVPRDDCEQVLALLKSWYPHCLEAWTQVRDPMQKIQKIP